MMRGILLCVFCSLVGAFAASAEQSAQDRRAEAKFRGRISAGQRYQRRFGPDFIFTLMP